jgi:hypothetical protein
LFFQAAHFGFDVMQSLKYGKSGGVNRFVCGKIDVLLEQADLQIVYFYDFAIVRRFFAGDEAKDRRFSRAVSPNESDFFARVYLKRNAAQNFVSAIGFLNV